MAVLLLAAFSMDAAAQERPLLDRAIDLANGAALVAHGADLATTTHCLAARTCVEANALLAPHVASPRTFFAIKMGTALASYYIKTRTKREHPRLTLAFAVAESAAFFLVAHHNDQIHQRAKGQLR